MNEPALARNADLPNNRAHHFAEAGPVESSCFESECRLPGFACALVSRRGGPSARSVSGPRHSRAIRSMPLRQYT
jgi:hypothetical protein